MDQSLAQSPVLDLSTVKENEHYRFSPGGVSRMLFPLLTSLKRGGIARGVEWVSLNPKAPPWVSVEGINLHHVAMPPEKMAGYGSMKEEIWRLFHAMSPHIRAMHFWQEEYMDYTYLNRVFSEKMEELGRQEDLDGFYIHDFQLLPLGHMLHSNRPKIFRWHIPFIEEELPKPLHGALVRYLRCYDAVVVSTKGYLKGLQRIGFDGTIYRLYPYIDPSKYPSPSAEEVRLFRDRFGIREGDRLILNVGRLDPMKSQHSLIFALKRVLKKVPDAKVMFVGNGSFSSSREGIGTSKAERWLGYLKGLAAELGVADRIVFTGYLNERDLRSAYAACDLFVLPSFREGFGLVVVEAWLYKKPTIVSSSSGVCDIIEEGNNGLTFDPKNEKDLAWKIVGVLKDPDFAAQLGKAGHRKSRLCHLEAGIKKESEILRKYIGGEGNGTG